MVDARLPEKLLADRRLMRLTPEAFRGYVLGLLWAVSNRTDGVIEVDDVDLVPRLSLPVAKDLVEAELWAATPTGFTIIDFTKWQSSRDELDRLEAIRAAERDKKRRQRSGRRATPHDGELDPLPPGVTGDTSPGPSPGTEQASDSSARSRTGAKGLPSADVESGFDDFYTAYPRKQARAEALKAYEAALKTTDSETILAGARAYNLLTAGKERQYIAHAATWLRGRRWEDDPIPETPSKDRAGQTKDERVLAVLEMGNRLATEGTQGPSVPLPPHVRALTGFCSKHDEYPLPCDRCDRDAQDHAGEPEPGFDPRELDPLAGNPF